MSDAIWRYVTDSALRGQMVMKRAPAVVRFGIGAMIACHLALFKPA